MKLKKLLTYLIVLLAITSCALAEDDQESLTSINNVTVTVGGESLTISWDAVPNASSYRIHFTSDGTEPTTSSDYKSASSTSYTHESLDETLTYRYKIEAISDDYDSSTSDATYGNMPMIIITIKGNFSGTGYENKNILVFYFEVDYDATEHTIANVNTVQTFTETPDTDGNISVSSTVSKSKDFGYTLCIDLDKSGTMNAGDIVIGADGNNDDASESYIYTYYSSLFSESGYIEKDWADLDYTHTF